MRRKILATCFLAAALGACSAPPSEEELLQRAEAALAARDVNAALLDIKTALQGNPESAEARLLYGRAYLFQQNPVAAIGEFERALEAGAGAGARLLLAKALVLGGETAELLSRHDAGEFAGLVADDEFQAVLARAQLVQGDYEAVRDALARIDATGNDYIDVTRAVVALQLDKEPARARELLEAVVARSPGQAYAWSVLGVLAAAEGDYEAAEAAYRRAAEANPFRLGDRLQLVNARLRGGDSEGADSELQRLEKLIPDSPQVNFLRGQLAFDAGEYRAALDALAGVLAVNPDHGGALLLSGLANLREDNLVTAQRQLGRFHDAVPGHLEAGLQLARVWLELGEPDKSEAVAREVLEEHDMNIKALGILAVALSAQGMHAESAAAYQQIATLQPESPEALMGVGMQRIVGGDSEAGVADLEAAVALDPDSAAPRERLIGAYLATGDLDAAQAAAEAYLEAAPDSPRASIFLGRVKLQSGETGAARTLFEQALAQDPGNVTASGGLAAVELLGGDLEAARDVFQSALEVNPGHMETSLNLAVIHERLGDLDAMRAVLEDAVAANEGAVAPRLPLARFALSEGRAGDALALLTPVAETGGDNIALLRLLTTAYLASGQSALASEAARQLLDRDPESPESLAVVARAELANGRAERAQAHLEAALEQAPGNTALRKRYIDVLVQQRKLDLAREQVAALPAAVQEETPLLVLRGRLALAGGEPAEAVPLFQQAFEQQRNNINLLFLASARWAGGERAPVLAMLAEWLEEYPEDALVRSDLATKQLMLGDETAAREQYAILVEQQPDNVAALNNLAWLLRTGDPKQALAHSERALDLAPDSLQVQDTYAMVLLENGETGRALALSARLLEEQPDNPELGYNRAQILARAGREDEAIELLEALVAGPAFPGKAGAEALLASLRGA
ncbi:MAG: XrtA/PEP-CTERM system TPR-repeat protein PrsT [Pseudohaliea sp.]